MAGLAMFQNFGKLPTKCPYPVQQRHKKGLHYLRPCGGCAACNLRKQNGRIGRHLAESKNTLSTVFTGTINDEHMAEHWFEPDYWKNECDNLQRRLRYYNKKLGFPNKTLVRFVAEKGGSTDRPHCHAVIHGIPEQIIKRQKWQIRDWWPYGHCELDAVKPKAIRYVLNYLSDPVKEAKVLFRRTSKGIGRRGFDQYVQHMREGRAKHGNKYTLYPDQYGVMEPVFQLDHRYYPIDPNLAQHWPFFEHRDAFLRHQKYLDDRELAAAEHGSILQAQWKNEDDFQRIERQKSELDKIRHLNEELPRYDR